MYETCPGGRFREVGIVAHVDDGDVQVLGGLTELTARQHLQILVDALETHTAIIGDVEAFATAFLGGHLNDSCSTTATVLSRL